MIKTINDKIVITYLYRSTNEEELNSFYDNVNNEKYNFRINKLYDDRIWKLNKDSYMSRVRFYHSNSQWCGSLLLLLKVSRV